MLFMGAGIGRCGTVIEKFAYPDVARDLHYLDVLVNQLLDDQRLFDIDQIDMGRALVRGMDDDRAHAEDALAKRDMDADVAHTVEQHLFHLHVQHPGL